MASSSNSTGQVPKLSQAGNEIFRKAVKYILTEWPSLDFAIDNGMGGLEAREKRSWMINHITETVLSGQDVDLEYYMSEILDQEFNTIIEDGSLDYNAKWIIKFYRDCTEGRHQEVLNSITQASKKKISLGNMAIPKPICDTRESSDDDDEDDDCESDDNQ